MNAPVIHIISKQKDLPELDNSNFFHSRQLFEIVKQTPRQRPYMVVATASDGRVLAHMLATVRYRTLWVPPYIYTHCRILGEGVYTYNHEGYSEYELFGQMLNALRSHIGYHVLYIEVSNLSEKMFAYRELKQQEFFPVRWMSIHNSLHSHTPEERISERLQHHIKNAYDKGVVTNEVKTEDDMRQFFKLLKRHHWLKPNAISPTRNSSISSSKKVTDDSISPVIMTTSSAVLPLSTASRTPTSGTPPSVASRLLSSILMN